MPLYTADALILKTYKLGEADRIVVFLTRDRGKKRGVAKGARRPRSRYMGALEPMTRAGVAYYEREQRELVRLNYVEPVRSPLSASTAEALGHAGYFAELIDEWSPEAHADERLFRLGSSMIDALASASPMIDAPASASPMIDALASASPMIDAPASASSIKDALAGGTPIETLARYFEYWLLRLQGVYPGLACAECGTAFGIGATALMPARQHLFFCATCAPPGGGTTLSPESIAFLLTARRLAPEKVECVPLTAGASRELETAHRRLIGLHLEKELKSARVLREMRQAR